MASDEQATRFEREHDPARVLALSDGVVAIIITLLVLEIHVPELSAGQSLTDAIRQIRPSFLAFLISFVVVAIAWVGHRDLFSLIRRTDRGTVWLNLLYLLPLTLLPFGASLLARFEREPVALRLYGLILIAIAAGRLLIWLYATARPHLLYVPIDRRSRRFGVGVVVGPAILYAIAVIVAPVAPSVSFWIYLGVPVVYFVGITIGRSSGPADAAERGFN